MAAPSTRPTHLNAISITCTMIQCHQLDSLLHHPHDGEDSENCDSTSRGFCATLTDVQHIVCVIVTLDENSKKLKMNFEYFSEYFNLKSDVLVFFPNFQYARKREGTGFLGSHPFPIMIGAKIMWNGDELALVLSKSSPLIHLHDQ